MTRKCKFCKINVADKKGSHIFTSSLISACVNQPFKKGRDKELMFGFGQDGSTDIFFGKQVLPEKIEEVKGSGMSPEEIDNNRNDIVYDYVYCTSCEKLFSVVESAFSPEIAKLRAGNSKTFRNPEIARVYFLIQVFRASSVKYNDWFLDEVFQEELRASLFDACQMIEVKKSIDSSSNIFRIPLLVTYLETSDDGTSNFVVIPSFKNPTALFLCDFVIQLFENTESLVSTNISIYNLNDRRIPDDFTKRDFNLYILSNSDRECLNDNLVRLDLAPNFIKSYQQKFIILSTQLGYIPTSKRIKYFTNLMFIEESSLTLVSEERFKECLKKTIKEIF